MGCMEKRLDQAADRYRQLGRIWYSAEVSTNLKLRIYIAGVVSVLTYGCECWDINEGCHKKVGSWNARRLAGITGREIREEYKAPSFDIMGCVRARRLVWLGKLLREEDTFLARRVALAELQQCAPRGLAGGIFQDAPDFGTPEELIGYAQDREYWGGLVQTMYPPYGRRKRGAAANTTYNNDIDMELHNKYMQRKADGILLILI